MTKREQLLKQRAEIDAELEALDNEWPNGTPGWFYHVDKRTALFGYLKNIIVKNKHRYGFCHDANLTEYKDWYISFQPLDCAILGREYTHDGSSECPVHPASEVRVELLSKAIELGRAYTVNWDKVKRYWIIKRDGGDNPGPSAN